MSKLQRLLMVLCSALIFIAASTAVASAAPTPVKITAYQGVTLNYNGQQVSSTNQPYIINNVTYVPFRILAESFGKQVSWDSANYCVVISDGSSSSAKELELYNQIAELKNQNTELQKTITSLKAQVTALQSSASSSTSTSKIADALEEAFDDAGDQYFDDDDLAFSFTVTGDEDDLVYNAKIDLSDSDKYDDLTECTTSNIQSFMSQIKSVIRSEISGTDFEDAKITGKLIDKSRTSYYVTYNGSSYSYSWGNADDIDDIEETVVDYFEDLEVGYYYFGDDEVEVTITVSGDEDDIAYRAKIDCSYSSDYDDITDISSTRLTNFMKALKNKIASTINDTDFEDADITGMAYDVDHTSYKITFDGDTYNFSW